MDENNQKPKRTNEEFLKDNLKYMGFGDSLYPLLEAQIKSGAPAFSMPISLEHNGKTIDYQLNFGKGKNNDMYFFNNFEATLPAEGKHQEIKQTFYTDNGISAKEAFNLLEGRSVKTKRYTKENVPYTAWAKLDFAQKNENGQHWVTTYGERYGYDLEAVLSKFIIREMDDPKRSEWLVKNLERGNLEQVMMVRGEKRVNDPNDITNLERPTFIEASPQFKGINLFDENKKKLYVVSDNSAKIQQPVHQEKSRSNGHQTANAQQVKQSPKTETGQNTTTVQTEKRSGPKR